MGRQDLTSVSPQSNTAAVQLIESTLRAAGPLSAYTEATVRLALTLALEIDSGDEAPSAALVNQYRATLADLSGKEGASAGDADSWLLRAVPSSVRDSA